MGVSTSRPPSHSAAEPTERDRPPAAVDQSSSAGLWRRAEESRDDSSSAEAPENEEWSPVDLQWA